jgi:hypothetical protein
MCQVIRTPVSLATKTTMGPLAQQARATLAAHHLFNGEWADPILWQGLEQRNVDYDAILETLLVAQSRPADLTGKLLLS